MTSDKTERFEDRLLSTLKEEVVRNASRLNAAGERAPGRRRLVTLPRAGMALAGSAAVAAGFVMVPGMTATPAYAVEEKPNGSVEVKISDLPFDKEQQQALASELEDAGVNVEIRNPEVGMTCTYGEAFQGRVGMVRASDTPSESGGDSVEPPPAPKPSGDSSKRERPLVDLEMTRDDSFVIENFVPREGAPHMSAFGSVKGDPPPCDPIPAALPPVDDD